MTYEERYAQLWQDMARREKHAPKLPGMAAKPSLKRAVNVDTLAAYLRANPGVPMRQMLDDFRVSDGQMRYALQMVPGAHRVTRAGVVRWYVREDA